MKIETTTQSTNITLQQAEPMIAGATSVGALYFFISSLLFILALSKSVNPEPFLAAAVVAALLTFGSYRKSRICIGLLLVGHALNLFALFVNSDMSFMPISAGIFGVYLAFVLYRAMQGCIAWHEIKSDQTSSNG